MRAAVVPPCAGGERVRMAESRVALVCPGQGAQKPGGVASLPASARAVFDRASALIGVDLWEGGLRGTPERLALPSILQPFLVAWAVAEDEQARAHRADLPPVDYVMGHSSGQNSAMVLGGAVGFADGVRFAHERGQRLDEGCRAEATGLVAVAGLERSEDRCHRRGVGRGAGQPQRSGPVRVGGGASPTLNRPAPWRSLAARKRRCCGWRGRFTASTFAPPTPPPSR